MNNPRPDQVAVSLLLISTLAVALPNLPAALVVPAGILIIVLPAYWWSRVILPSLTGRSAETILATLVLVAVIVITLVLVLYGTGIRVTNIALALSLATLGVAGWRLSTRVSAGDTPVAGAPGPALRVGRLPSPRRRDLVILLIAVIVLGGTAVLARTPLSPPAGVQGYSQLWLLPQPAGLQLGVASFELRRTHYRLELVADGAVVRTWDDVLLAPGQRFTEEVVAPGSFIEARLYLKDNSSPDPYRTVHIGGPAPTTAPP
jgi:hypothetical protein